MPCASPATHVPGMAARGAARLSAWSYAIFLCHAPVISLEILAQLRLLMPEKAVREIFQAIVTDLDRRTQALEAAIARGDSAEMGRIGHAIKGGCAMAGALQAARLGALIENAALDPAGNQSDNSVMLLKDLRLAAQALKSMLDAELPA